jgi:chemotaxis protein methyltransferase CheR
MDELGLAEVAAYRARLEADPAEWAILDACCWISISRFHRDRVVFEDLGAGILPELARAAAADGRSALRAWSAGCASGEEPYSLRLVWDLLVAPGWPDVGLEIVATDVSSELLERAHRGVYAYSALKDLPAGWRSRAFVETQGHLRLRDEFRVGVALRKEDFRESMPESPFDLVLCRNLAFTYFDLDLQWTILEGLGERLAPRGFLLIGAHERLPESPHFMGMGRTPGLYRPRRSDAGSS